MVQRDVTVRKAEGQELTGGSQLRAHLPELVVLARPQGESPGGVRPRNGTAVRNHRKYPLHIIAAIPQSMPQREMSLPKERGT